MLGVGKAKKVDMSGQKAAAKSESKPFSREWRTLAGPPCQPAFPGTKMLLKVRVGRTCLPGPTGPVARAAAGLTEEQLTREG